MNCEDIVKKSLEKLSQDFEIRNSLYLSIIHRNIDTLVLNSNTWFGEDVPTEFVDVLNSLINFTVLISEKTRTISELVQERSFQKFKPYSILDELRYDFIEMITFNKFTLSGNQDTLISTSLDVFRDSLYHIFFSISQFVQSNSEAFCKVIEDGSTVFIKLNFHDLEDSLPDVKTLLRLFFTDEHTNISTDNQLGLKIGLSIAVENIQRIGGIINIDNLSDSKLLEIVISFPTIAFLETIKDVRRYELEESSQQNNIVVLLSVVDKITELILSESFSKHGYSVVVENLTKIKLHNSYTLIQYIVVDYENILQFYEDPSLFYSTHSEKKIIVIHKAATIPAEHKQIIFISIPFEIDQILEKLK